MATVDRDQHGPTVDHWGSRHYAHGLVVSLAGTQRLYVIMDKPRPILVEIHDMIKSHPEMVFHDRLREQLARLDVTPEEALELINSGRVEKLVETNRALGK
jgi:hypothetical protein